MSSQRKIDSARANGAKSHGPITEEGRKIASMNALKYGLTARTVVLPDEDQQEYDLFLEAYFNDLLPVGIYEKDQVVEMVNAKWRQRRLCGIESVLFQRESFKSQETVEDEYESYSEVVPHSYAFCNLAKDGSLPMLNRIESRLVYTYSHAYRNLDQRRARRERQNEKRTQSQDRTLMQALSPVEPSNENN